MTVSFLAWLALIGAIAVMLVIDLLVVGRRGGEMSLRFASLASVVWVAIALAFGGLLWLIGETGAAADYTAGYLVEKSLSLDNVFVFLLVFSAFGVAEAERHRLLTYGIVGALVMRAVFIVIGAAALERFSWIAFGFAALLIYTGWSMFRHRHDHDSEEALVDKLRKPTRRLERGRESAGRPWAARRSRASRSSTSSSPSTPCRRSSRSPRSRSSCSPPTRSRCSACGRCSSSWRSSSSGSTPQDRARAAAVAIGLKMAAGELFGKIGPEYSLPGIALILGTGVVASLVRQRREDRRAVAA